MNSKLFDRIKKLAKNDGKVVVIDESGEDAFVIQSLDDYEGENFCGLPEAFDFDDAEDDETEEVKVAEAGLPADFGVDEELMKKVNEDIAEWRKNQEVAEKKEVKKEEKAPEIPEEPASEGVLTEEERYYLEPLE
jgi:hypothetical protein